MPAKGEELTDLRQTVANIGNQTARASMDERETKFRPVLFEKKILKNPDFYRLSDGFKRLFSKDAKDPTLRIPIAGFGGHI